MQHAGKRSAAWAVPFLIAVTILAGAVTSRLAVAQTAGAQQPPAQNAQGRGGGRAGRGGDVQGRGPRRGGFPQFTRELPPPDVMVRGKSLYEANCASCHATDI